jgi:hypothetical protein
MREVRMASQPGQGDTASEAELRALNDLDAQTDLLLESAQEALAAGRSSGASVSLRSRWGSSRTPLNGIRDGRRSGGIPATM